MVQNWTDLKTEVDRTRQDWTEAFRSGLRSLVLSSSVFCPVRFWTEGTEDRTGTELKLGFFLINCGPLENQTSFLLLGLASPRLFGFCCFWVPFSLSSPFESSHFCLTASPRRRQPGRRFLSSVSILCLSRSVTLQVAVLAEARVLTGGWLYDGIGSPSRSLPCSSWWI